MKRILTITALLLIMFNNSRAQEVFFLSHLVDDNFDGATGIFIADINNDGYKDIISSALDAGAIAWWENQPGDSISWQKHFVDSNFPNAIYCSAYDVDNDGNKDILGAAYYSNVIAWWHNDGENPVQWTKQVIDSNFTHAHEIMAFDVDLDNDMDILAVAAGANTIAWFENDGNYPVQWTKHIVDNDFAGARSVDAGDLDGDGDIDLAGAALDDNEIAWWRNDGGTPIAWTKVSVHTNFMYAHKVQIVDVDLDGFPDILGTAYSSGISWWKNDGNDSINWEKHIISQHYSLVIAWALDLNQDTDMDVVGTAQGSGFIAFWENKNLNSLDWDFNYLEALAGAWPLYYGDLDNDGDFDLVCGGRDANEIRWYENDLVTSIETPLSIATNKPEIQCYPSPFDHDVTFSMLIKKNQFVQVRIYDITGQKINTLVSGHLQKGEHQIVWHGNNCNPGIYFAQILFEDYKKTIKLIKIK